MGYLTKEQNKIIMDELRIGMTKHIEKLGLFNTIIKQQSTGDNDSLEDVLIAIGNLKTEDGKLLGIMDGIKEVRKALEERERIAKEIQGGKQ